MTLSLDATLDAAGMVSEAAVTDITAADLLDTTGAVVKTATITGGNAVFDLGGLSAGDFFIRVNGDADDLVPTRITDPMADIVQGVNHDLSNTVIGPTADPSFHIATFSKGNGDHQIVKYSDGSNVSPEEYAYVLLDLKAAAPGTEIRVLGTAAQLTTLTAGASHPFPGWMLGGSNHGIAYGGTASNCICHGDLDSKSATFAGISMANGWCFRCHSGKEGDENGFVEPTL